MPAGATQGAAQVTIKLVAVIVEGAISSEKTAVIAVLVGTSGVMRGTVVAGTVIVTLGWVVSGASPVVKVHTKLLNNARPVVSLDPVVMVAVQSVLGGSADAGVKVETRPAAL